MHGSADSSCAVSGHGQMNGWIDRGLKERKHALDLINHLDDVRSGLTEDDDEHRRLSIGQPGIAGVLLRFKYVRDVHQTYRRAIPDRDNQVLILVRLQQLVIGSDGEHVLLILE